jgi:hypothetical protein
MYDYLVATHLVDASAQETGSGNITLNEKEVIQFPVGVRGHFYCIRENHSNNQGVRGQLGKPDSLLA